MFRLAHLSDPHLGPLPAASLGDLASKRILGYLNWHMHRARSVMQAGSLEAIVADIHRAGPDHIVVTGDLINIGLAPEIARAGAWLAGLGAPQDVSLVPGNHDAYVPGALPRALASWRPYVSGDSATEAAFPYLRRRGDIALIGVSSAIATGPFMATGLVDTAQLQRLRALLHETGEAGLCRVVMIHHLAIDGATKWKSRLLQADRFRAIIAEAGAELILHGHTHRASLHWIARAQHGTGAAVPVLGVQSASLQPSPTQRGAGWNLIEIDGEPGRWSITHADYGVAPGESTIAEVSRARLRPRPPAP